MSDEVLQELKKLRQDFDCRINRVADKIQRTNKNPQSNPNACRRGRGGAGSNSRDCGNCQYLKEAVMAELNHNTSAVKKKLGDLVLRIEDSIGCKGQNTAVKEEVLSEIKQMIADYQEKGKEHPFGLEVLKACGPLPDSCLPEVQPLIHDYQQKFDEALSMFQGSLNCWEKKGPSSCAADESSSCKQAVARPRPVARCDIENGCCGFESTQQCRKSDNLCYLVRSYENIQNTAFSAMDSAKALCQAKKESENAMKSLIENTSSTNQDDKTSERAESLR